MDDAGSGAGRRRAPGRAARCAGVALLTGAVLLGAAPVGAAPSPATTPTVEPAAPEAPSPPTGVVATPGAGQATVSWPPVVAGSGVVRGYEVRSSPGDDVAVVAGGTTTVEVVGLPVGEALTFTVVALGDGSRSLPSPPSTPITVAPPAVAFDDVGAGHPFAAEVTWSAEAGLTRGYSRPAGPAGGSTFRPAAPLTRQALAAAVHRLRRRDGGPGREAETGVVGACEVAPFPDVPVSHPFCPEIAALARAGILMGYADGAFQPATPASRGALAAVLHRTAGAGPPVRTCSAAPAPDVAPTDPRCRAIAWLQATGRAQGYPDGTFQPDRPVTRQAATALAHRHATGTRARLRGAVAIAHRGASSYAPEHTFAAYDLALAQGADALELDLQLTADGELVALHDPVLGRTARGPAEACTGPVSARTVAELRRCDVGSWFGEAHPHLADPAHVGLGIPTLVEVLARYGPDARYYLELKATRPVGVAEAALLAALDGAGLRTEDGRFPPVVVQSFDADALRRLHALRPELPLVQLLGLGQEPLDGPALDDVATYAWAIGPSRIGLDAPAVDAAHARCLGVHPYTVDDDADEVDRLLALGVDAVFADAPDVVLERRGRHPAPIRRCPQPGAPA